MRRRLTTIAQWINDNMPGYRAKTEQGYADTDRKIGRLRVPGKGRYGTRLKVWRGTELVLDHNNAETYRRTSEVEAWLRAELRRG